MAGKHPYASPGNLNAAVSHFRKSFPTEISVGTLRKLSIAPGHESDVITALRFIGVIDAEGNKTDKSISTFSQHESVTFQKAFGDMVKDAYADLFKLHGDGAWELDSDKLISFFREADKTSDERGRGQAATFKALAALAGHGELNAPQKSSSKPKEAKLKGPKARGTDRPLVNKNELTPAATGHARDVGLTVRIEVNLPAGADQQTYDSIFRSIRENLLNAK
jgi:hypothetical protein